MNLKDIGFYTLCDERAATASVSSQLQRCELILLDACNFACPYCRGLEKEICGTMPLDKAKQIVDYWAKDNLKNIRLSGGEPTIYPRLVELVKYIKNRNIERIAISTNGSADFSLYEELVKAGVNDFSISLDACCSEDGDKMAGGIKGAWETVVDNIRKISKLTYTTVGVVLTEQNVDKINDIISFAHNLGVSDIRIIPAAQNGKSLHNVYVDELLLEKYPILRYRIQNIKMEKTVRGLCSSDCKKCPLVLDDMAIAGNFHYPCIIYLREKGKAIGKVGPNMRQERAEWMENHNCYEDQICRGNCLDVCVEYNNKWQRYAIEKTSLTKLDPTLFDWSAWRSFDSSVFAIPFDYNTITSIDGKRKFKQYAVGWCFAENLMCRSKENCVAVMFKNGDEFFWTHLFNSEFFEIFC